MTKKPSLAETHPEVAKQWHQTKNGDLTAGKVTQGSGKKVWWKCDKGNDHVWEATIVNRTKGRNCPVCSGHKLTLSNCLATKNPDLAKEWHPTKNGSLTPFDIVAGGRKKVWWKCDVSDDHEWEAVMYSRLEGNSCPFCSGQKVAMSNSFGKLYPELAKEWHPVKNGKLNPFEVSKGSKKKVWWKCNKADDHEWLASIGPRVNGTGCPICSGKITVKSNSLFSLKTELANQWHPTLNKNLNPNDVSVFSNKWVWWKCEKGDDHVWEARVSSRSKGNGCPICSGDKIVDSNSLQTTNPDLAKEWHPTKNGSLTPFDIVAGSRKKVWWKCDVSDDHEWEAVMYSRLEGNSCPFCTLTPQSKQELIITFELKKIFKNINPKGYKTRLDGKLRAIDIFIPELNLAIEFDGSYWHKDKRAIDKIKSEMLMEKGYQAIRIREEPLKKIYKNDIISTKPYSGKDVTNKILKRILDIFNLSNSAERKIQNYISKDSLQNEKALDKYIDQILEEKAVKTK